MAQVVDSDRMRGAPATVEGAPGARILDMPGAAPAPSANASFGAILTDLVSSIQHLMRQQVELARAETTEQISAQVKEKGTGIGLLAGGGVFALFALAFLGITLLFGFQEWFGLSGWLSALIVMFIYLVIGGILAFLGMRVLRPAQPPAGAPEQDTPYTE